MPVGITFKNITKRFGTTLALDRIDLAIEPGELFFLLGPSGCGKTTLLRALAGFNEPEEGSIFVGDRDVTRLPPHQRDTGMVFQSYALWPHMDVGQNVAFGLEMRKLGKREIEERTGRALELVKMADRRHHKPNQLSGGQQQRVALARALVIEPKCLLLDEPLSNLDAKLRLEMRGEIRRICKEAELTAIYVTHDQKEALSIADRLAVMEGGRIRQCGRPLEVYRRPQSRFVAHFIGETNFIEGRVASVNGDAAVVDTALGPVTGCALHPAGLTRGQLVTISLRPEVVRFDPPPEGMPNRFPGRVHGTVYLGEIAQHRVTLPGAAGASAGEIELKAFDLNPKIVARDTTEAATVWFAPEDVLILTS